VRGLTMERMSAAEYRRAVVYDMQEKKRGNKYGAVRAYRCEPCCVSVPTKESSCPICKGNQIIGFDSMAEAGRYDLLRNLQKLGLISELRRQVPYEISIEGRKTATYKADFTYWDDRQVFHVEDVKGKDTALSALKRKQVEAQYGIKVELVR